MLTLIRTRVGYLGTGILKMVALLLLAVAIVVAVLSNTQPQSGTKHNDNGNQVAPAASATPLSIAIDSQQFPLYPGAKGLDQWGDPKRPLPLIEYEVDATVENVTTFYKETLVSRGWKVKKESLNRAAFITFLWDNNGDLPWNLEVGVAIGAQALLTGGLTDVNMFPEKVPGPSLVPIVLNAQSIEVLTTTSEYGLERMTSFVVPVSLAEVGEFYEETLPKHGWELVSSNRSEKDLTLSYGYWEGGGSPHGMHTSSLDVIAVRKSNQTAVILEVRDNYVLYSP